MSKFTQTPNTCNPDRLKKCDKPYYPKRSLCFASAVMKDKESDFREYLAPDSECLGYDEVHLVRDSYEVEEVLNKYKKNCGTVTKIKLFGHANPVNHQITGRSRDLASTFEDFSCVIEPGAEVYFKGCNTGNHCAGRAAMYDIAENLLKKGGKVISPSWYAVTFGGVHSAFSGNFRNRHLTMDKNGNQDWDLVGATLAKGDNLPVSCKSACQKVLDIIDKYEPLLEKYSNCEWLLKYFKVDSAFVRCANYKNVENVSSRKFIEDVLNRGTGLPASKLGEVLYYLEEHYTKEAFNCIERERKLDSKKRGKSGSIKN